MKKILLLFVLALGVFLNDHLTAQVTCPGPLTVTVEGSGTGLPLGVTVGSTPLSCYSANGSPNATVTATPTGGSTPYQYAWAAGTGGSLAGSTATDGATINNLPAGTYTVTITDAKGCIQTTNTTITSPTQIVPSAVMTPKSNTYGISCALASTGPNSDGEAVASATGGAGNYTYAWGPAAADQTTATATGLAFGTYTVTIKDANTCTATKEVSITKPADLVSTSAYTQPDCNAANTSGVNGTATITPAGGTPTYTYAWATAPAAGQTVATAINLGTGTYTVTATDASGCTVTQSYTLTEPIALANTFAKSSYNGAEISCTTGQGTINDGSLTASISGGTSGYSYKWSTTPEQTTAAATGLIAGTYTVTVTDSKMCTQSFSSSLVAPTAISATGDQTNLSCNASNGAPTGAVDLTPAGGSGAYAYSWATGGQTTEDVSTLAAGTYTVTVTDANSCTFSTSFTITQPTPITFVTVPSAYNGYGVSCNTGMPSPNVSNNGTVTVNSAAGGNGSYTYSINGTTFGTDATFSSLTPATYTVIVKDVNGCTASGTQAITQPPMIVAGTCTTAQDKCQLNAGEIKVEAAGGAGILTVTWTATGALGVTPAGSPDGTGTTPGETIPTSGGSVTYTGMTGNATYNFVITDANGCHIP